ncbi:hypothetical protein [Ammoniphilus resinae]|uniref:Uncharacterized protein n=1 Tax=Ammoniphilus resinae TaxID=861532 RepID=A0ABS4GMP2_9BACL|nr:hypothetical protein [Ammoniphilus resinae]MBP1931377.1 hypothetical protein [Ammoniphilus resinae]
MRHKIIEQMEWDLFTLFLFIVVFNSLMFLSSQELRILDSFLAGLITVGILKAIEKE